MTKVLSAIIDVMREVRPDDVAMISPQTLFRDLVDWDSADLVAIVVEAECRFGIELELAEIDRLATVDDLVRIVTEKQALQSAA